MRVLFPIKLCLLIFLCIFVCDNINAQSGDPLPQFSTKRTVFSKVSGHAGKNIFLKLDIFNDNRITLSINFSGKTKTADIADLQIIPVENIIADSINKFEDPVTTHSFSDLFADQDRIVIHRMILEALAFINSGNTLNRDSITAVFQFKREMPLYFSKDNEVPYDPTTVERLINSNIANRGANEIVDTLANERNLRLATTQLRDLKRDSTWLFGRILEQNGARKKLEVEKAELDGIKGTLTEQLKIDILEFNIARKDESINAIQRAIATAERELSNKSREIAELSEQVRAMGGSTGSQPMQTDVSGNEKELGKLIIDKLELVVNDGFTQTLRITLKDSFQLAPEYGGKKVPLKDYNIKDHIEYHFSLDLRSVAFAQSELDQQYAIWRINNNDSILYTTNLGKFIIYDPPSKAYITDLFVARTQRIFFNGADAKSYSTTVKETDINTVFKINLFADLVGVQEDQPNGLLQAEASFRTHLFKWTTNTTPTTNKWYWFDHLEAKLRLSKIENKLRYLNVPLDKGSTPAKPFIPSLQLIQFANLDAGVKVSLLKIAGYKREFDFYISSGIVRTGLRDTLLQVVGTDTTKTPRTYHILSNRTSIMPHLKLRATSYVGVDISCEFSGIKLLDRDILQSGASFSRDTTNNTFGEFKYSKNILINPQVQAYYMPDEDESKRLYIRLSYIKDVGTLSNSFLQIQFGYASDIKRFLNFKSTK